MLIRSQDKTELINLNNATSISTIPEYGNKKGIVVRLIGEDRWTILGHYSDEKALKVLDWIGEDYSNDEKIFIMPQEDEI